MTVAEVTYCNSISVSEHVVMMILIVGAQLHSVVPVGGQRGWNIADCVARSYDLEGMAVGTVAAGRIGLAVLRRLKPFDVKLHYTDRHRLPESVEKELNLTYHPNVESMVRVCDVGHDQLPAAPRDRAYVQRSADRQDETRRVHRQYGARQDLRPRCNSPGARERAACRLRR